jgi:hypothetical protein
MAGTRPWAELAHPRTTLLALPGAPLYSTLGYEERARRAMAFAGGDALPVVDMEKRLGQRGGAEVAAAEMA